MNNEISYEAARTYFVLERTQKAVTVMQHNYTFFLFDGQRNFTIKS